MSTVEEIYNRIGERIVISISDDWKSAVLNIEYIGGVKSALEYQNKSDKVKSIGLKDSFINMRDIKELHQITTSNNSNKWNMAKFSVWPDGRFKMVFKWDQKLQDEVESYIDK